ncbi:MAG TPA: peptidylprolyl isomerase [bacterium]|nr:peptidylprolyl isomerase [bacterium]
MIRKLGLLLLCSLWFAGCTAKSNPKVIFETTQGNFTAELFADVPTTTQNFVDLVSAGFYNGLTFHRYEPNFVIQGGDPTGTGMGNSGKTIPLEITAHQHVQGALAMARSQDPNSASCQFYVCLADAHFLDGQYAVFGQVIEGMDNVLKLRKGDKMLKVTLVK